MSLSHSILLCLVLSGAGANNLGTDCIPDSDCTTLNAFCNRPYQLCSRGYCQCLSDFYQTNNGECQLKAEVGESCISDGDCLATTGGTHCTNSDVCECVNSHELVSDVQDDGMRYCYESRAGEPCEDDSNCLTYVVNHEAGRCVNEVCGCKPEYILNGDVCSSVGHGESCSHSGENLTRKSCRGEMICNIYEICECPNSHTFNEEYQQCAHDTVSFVGPGNSCDVGDLAISSPNTKICDSASQLVCDICPGTTEDSVCHQAPGGSSRTSLNTVLLSVSISVGLFTIFSLQ